jgi:hypothetical protein
VEDFRTYHANPFSLAGQKDWRLPRIKEVYSLALFSGVDAGSREMSGMPSGAKPFIDSVFDFQYGTNGLRPIDTQLLSSTIYQCKTGSSQEFVGEKWFKRLKA